MKDTSIKESEYFKIANRVSIITVFSNLLLSIFKFVAGAIAHSAAMISDAIHSASDVLSTFVVMVGLRISAKEPDKEHPYGHERLECVASIVLAVLLASVGIGIGYKGASNIIFQDNDSFIVPGRLALVASLVSIITKEIMYHYTQRAAKKINSTSLMADAWHHRSDSFSSIGALIGIWGARNGYPILDPVASVIICIFILKAAIEIFMDAVDKMVDKACDEEIVQKFRHTASEVEGVECIEVLRSRMFGAKIFIDMEIAVDGSMTLERAHTIAEKVHDEIESAYPEVKHIMVHVNPLKKGVTNA